MKEKANTPISFSLYINNILQKSSSELNTNLPQRNNKTDLHPELEKLIKQI